MTTTAKAQAMAIGSTSGLGPCWILNMTIEPVPMNSNKKDAMASPTSVPMLRWPVSARLRGVRNAPPR